MRRAIAFAVVVAFVAAELPARAGENAVETPEAAAAKVHYDKAQELYATGSYDEAIAEYEEAYRLKPHPNVLYNIAQAYERLLDYAQSVVWFERYLAEAPKDAVERPIVENRLRILRNLPARISVTTIPEHVHAALVDAGGRRHEADTPALFKVPAGTYTIELAQPGWESESHDVAVDLGQPYFYQYRLKRSTAQVSIFTRPRGARVFIDDRLVGETPFAGTLDVGRHKLLLEHRDYPWHNEDLDVKAGAPIQREITLTRPIRSGRTELVIASMVFGGAAGPLLVASALGDSTFGNSGLGLLVYMLASGAGIGAGFLGSFLATRDGVKVGMSSLMIGSAVWGTSLATSLSLGLDVPTRYVYSLAIAGSGIGMSAGFLIARKLDISAGDAALVNSGGTWGTATGALLAQAIIRNPSGSQFGWFILGGTTAGVLTGSLLAWKVELSRGHVGLIDVGGLAGTGLGFALGYVIGVNSQSEDNIQTGARYALGGMALGLLAGAVMTRKYKGDVPPVEALLRRDHGRWAFGLPALNVEPAITPEGTTTRLSLTLARG
ncbi:MAG TPA: PEGA domain-containing protein, partial [Polyangia bacterium]